MSELTLFRTSEGKFNVTNFEERKEGRLVDALDWIELMKQRIGGIGMDRIGLERKGKERKGRGEERRQEGKIDTMEESMEDGWKIEKGYPLLVIDFFWVFPNLDAWICDFILMSFCVDI